MAEANDTMRTPAGQPPVAEYLYLRDLPLAEVDILGDFDDGNYIAGNALLADLVCGRCDRDGQNDTLLDQAASRLHLEQLGELAAPASDLADVALKLAWAVRMGHFVLDDNGTYGDRTLRLLGSTLSDVLLLRQAELVRRREPGAGNVPTG